MGQSISIDAFHSQDELLGEENIGSAFVDEFDVRIDDLTADTCQTEHSECLLI